MSVGELTQRVVTTYTAVVSDHVSKVKDIDQSVKTLAKTEADRAKAATEGNKGLIKGLGELGLAYSAVSGAVTSAMAAMKTYAEHTRLEYAAGTANIDKMAEAAGGLLTRTELLTLAAKAQHGAYGATQKQLEDAAGAIRKHIRDGYDQETAINAVTNALVANKDKGLKQVGEQIRKTSSDAEKHSEILRKLAGDHDAVGKSSQTAAEKMAASQVSMHDAFEKIKLAFGQLAASMTPLIEATAKVIGMIAGLLDEIIKYAKKNPMGALGSFIGGAAGGAVGEFLDESNDAGALTMKNIALGYARSPVGTLSGNKWSSYATDGITPDGDIGGLAAGKYASTGAAGEVEALGPAVKKGAGEWDGRGGESDAKNFQKAMTKLKWEFWGAMHEMAYEASATLGDFVSDGRNEHRMSMFESVHVGDPGRAGSFAGSLDEQNPDWRSGGKTDWSQLGSDSDEHYKLSGQQREDWNKGYDKFNKNKEQSFLENSFGKLEDFNKYKMAFDTLTGAVSASMNAWIDGSGSAGKAFKHFIADALKGLASQLMVESLKHGAYALGSLAFGDVSGAGRHAAAALAFGAGAAAAAVAAKELGTTAGDANAAKASAAAGGGSGSGGGGRGGGDSGGARPIIIVTGDDMTRQTDRMRAINARRYIEQGLLQAGYTPGGE